MAELAAAPAVGLHEVRSEKEPAFAAAYRLLRGTFPSAKLLAQRDWIEVMRERAAGLWSDTAWHLLVARRGGRLVGVVSGSYLGGLNVGMVGYLAVAHGARAGGVGQRLRRGLHEAFERDARRVHHRKLRAIVGEVHADNPWLIHVVQRRGAIALDMPYFQPRMSWRRPPVRLVLYYQPLGPGPHPRSLPVADVRQLVYAVWRNVYRVARPLSRPAFRRMLAALEERERVGQMRLG